jgi:hypothetical protein
MEPVPQANVGERRPRGESTESLWWTTRAPLLVSLASMFFSLLVTAYTIYEANREPEVWLSAPDVVRIATGENTGWFYVQPRLINTARNDREAVITKFQLEVAAPDGQQPAIFNCDEFGSWQYDSVNRWLYWMYQGDAAPLAVSPASPQLPTCNFIGPFGWSWKPGDYQVIILAWLPQKSEPLRASFTMTVSDQALEYITTYQTYVWELPARAGSVPLSHSTVLR